MADGRPIRFTNLDKVLFPATGTTKADVIAYYAEVAEVLLPHLRQRPVTRKRWPEGVGTTDQPGPVFFAKHLPAGTPAWVPRFPIEHRDHVNDYPVVNDVATLAWLGQLAVLELHVPQWRFDEQGRALPPDRMVLDLDPGEGVSLADCAEVAGWTRELLAAEQLALVPVTSGSKGIHLYAPLDGTHTSAQVTDLARSVAHALQADHPDRVTAVMSRADRGGKVFLDWSQNNGAKTTISPYSLRGRGRPYVAAPRTWDELTAPDLRQLDYAEVLSRVTSRGDLLAILLGPLGLGAAAEAAPAGRRPPLLSNSRVAEPRRVGLPHTEPTVSTPGPRPSPPSQVRPLDSMPSAAATTQLVPAAAATTQPVPAAATQPVPAAAATTQPVRAGATQPVPSPAATSAFPPAVEPMLATLATANEIGDERGWAFEMKWDGVRILVYLERGQVRLLSRTGRDETQRYPELVTELAGLDCQRAVLDGEIVAPDASGRPSFALLQPRINLSRPADIAAAARQTPTRLMLFDVLSLDGQPLVGEPYENRRHALERLVAVHSGNGVQAPPAFDGDLAAALEASSAFGLEGVVAKRMGSPYQSGRRGRAWLKIKHRRSQAVVVGGWSSGQGHRASTLGSLLLGIPSSDGLRFVGKAGSGFTDAALVQAHRALEPLARSTTPFVEVTGRDAQNAHWVEPTLVGEVYYTEATSAGRLRHPVWKGWRPDVPPTTVVWE